MKDETYKKCECGSDCNLEWYEENDYPCWGEVCLVDRTYVDKTGDVLETHACEGHCGLIYMNGRYYYKEDKI